MGICCGKTHPQVIQVEGKKEVATSTSYLKDKLQDAENTSSENKSEDRKLSPLPSVDTKIVTKEEDLFDAAAARTQYSTFKHDSDDDPARRGSMYVEGRRIGQDEDHITKTLTGQRRKSEGVTNNTGKHFPPRLSLPEGVALLDFKETFENKSEDSKLSPLPSVDTKIVTDEEDLFDAAAARTQYSTFKHDSDDDPARRGSMYVEGRRISKDEDHITKTLIGQRRKSEGVTNNTGKHFPTRLSLPEGKALLDFKETFEGFIADDIINEDPYIDKVILEKEKAILSGVNQELEDEGRRSLDVQNTGNVVCNTEEVEPDKESASSSDEDESQKEDDSKINECHAEKTSLNLEGTDQRDEEIEVTSRSKDESETESFFDVKGEMLSLFNRLESEASFIHAYTVEEQDRKSTSSEDHSSNGEGSLVREMEAIFQELKQQNQPTSSHSMANSDKVSEEGSFFDMSKEIEKIISNFDKCSISSKRSDTENSSDASLKATPGDSTDSGSFFHIQGELESRLQDLVLHLDDSKSNEECQGTKSGLSEEELASNEGSYFNMQDEIELRLDLIRHGNAI